MNKSAWHDLETEAAEVATTTRQQNQNVCTFLQEGFSVIADGFSVAEAQDSGDLATVRMALFSQSLGSLKCSIDLAMRGYYTQAPSLLRIVYENWIAFLYVGQHPADANLWLNQDKRPPQHSVMLNALDDNLLPKKNAREWYGMLCHFYKRYD